MQARAAYIRSIGTTGILVAAALLMLATVSALVAYEGWPGTAGGEPVTSVPVQTPREVRVVRTVTKAPAAAKLVSREVAATSTVGLVRDVTAYGPSTVGLVKVPPASAPAAPAPVAGPAPSPGVQAPPIAEPTPPSPPSVAVPELLPPPADGVDENAFGLLGTALPVGEDGSGAPLEDGVLDGLRLPLP